MENFISCAVTHPPTTVTKNENTLKIICFQPTKVHIFGKLVVFFIQ